MDQVLHETLQNQIKELQEENRIIRGKLWEIGKEVRCHPFFNIVRARHFIDRLSRSEAERLFKESVELVEIEVHSFCNRKCSFCPNSFIDRRTHVSYLDVDAYERVTLELGAISYSKTISFSRYNEPFGDLVFFDCLRIAKKNAPLAFLHTNSNGDFLDMETLEKAYSQGLRGLNIQLYFADDEDFSFANCQLKLENIKKRLKDISFVHSQTRSDGNTYWFTGEWRDMIINAYSRNFSNVGINRCDLPVCSESRKRYSPCFQPVNSVYVDFTGSVMPCCNLRSDYIPHKEFILGSILEKGLVDIYCGKRAVEMRKELFTFEEKSGPCANCHFIEVESTLANKFSCSEIFQRINKTLIG